MWVLPLKNKASGGYWEIRITTRSCSIDRTRSRCGARCVDGSALEKFWLTSERKLQRRTCWAAVEELGTCVREMSSQPLDGTISGVDHRRFNRASVQLQLEFPKSPEIISDLLVSATEITACLASEVRTNTCPGVARMQCPERAKVLRRSLRTQTCPL